MKNTSERVVDIYKKKNPYKPRKRLGSTGTSKKNPVKLARKISPKTALDIVSRVLNY